MTESWLDLSGKVVVVTGGSMGLGEKMVDGLAANGARVISADVVENDSHANQKNVVKMICDVTSKTSVEKMVQEVIKQFGHLDVLINNAGVSRPRMLVDYYGKHPEYELSEDFDFMTTVNQKASFSAHKR